MKWNAIYQSHPSYQTSGLKLKKKRQNKTKQKKKVFIHLSKSENQKNLPGGEPNPGLPRDRRGYSPLHYRGIECVGIKLNGQMFHRKLSPLHFNYKFLSSSFDDQNEEELKLKHFV